MAFAGPTWSAVIDTDKLDGVNRRERTTRGARWPAGEGIVFALAEVPYAQRPKEARTGRRPGLFGGLQGVLIGRLAIEAVSGLDIVVIRELRRVNFTETVLAPSVSVNLSLQYSPQY